MNKIIITGFIALSTSVSAFTDRAEVLSINKVLKTQIYQTPYEDCRSEEVPVYSQNDNSSYTDEIFGGILGGVIGNQLGGGRGNKAATVAGTLLGASIASDNSRSSGTRIVGYRQVQRCETKYKQESRESIDYYLVTAKYNSKEFTFKTDTQPGDTVKVTVSPEY
jgi:uncharacterized protein YcfJ